MSILGRLFGNQAGPKTDARPAEQIAREIVTRYRRRLSKGECRVDDNLFVELCQQIPEPAAREVITRFKERRARSDDKAEQKLAAEIAIAINDARHWRATARPIIRQAEQVAEAADNQPASANRTYAKVLQGRPLKEEDEDAVLFGDIP